MPVRFRPNLDEGLKAEKAKIANADAYNQARIDQLTDPNVDTDMDVSRPRYDPKAKFQQSVGSLSKAQVKSKARKLNKRDIDNILRISARDS